MVLLILNFCTGLYPDDDGNLHRVVCYNSLFHSTLYTADGVFPVNLTPQELSVYNELAEIMGSI